MQDKHVDEQQGYAGYTFRRAVRKAIGNEISDWVEFTPNVQQGAYLAKTSDTFAYYKYTAGEMRVEIFIKINATGTANNPIIVNGWPTDYNIAARAQRFSVGEFLLHDASDGAGGKSYDGQAVTYYDDICGFSFTSTAGRPLYGQTGSGAAITLAASDEIAISAHWRV